MILCSKVINVIANIKLTTNEDWMQSLYKKIPEWMNSEYELFSYVHNEETSTHAAVIKAKRYVVVVFRGTKDAKNMRNDMKINLVPYGGSYNTTIKVHQGFLQSWTPVKDEVIDAVRRARRVYTRETFLQRARELLRHKITFYSVLKTILIEEQGFELFFRNRQSLRDVIIEYFSENLDQVERPIASLSGTNNNTSTNGKKHETTHTMTNIYDDVVYQKYKDGIFTEEEYQNIVLQKPKDFDNMHATCWSKGVDYGQQEVIISIDVNIEYKVKKQDLSPRYKVLLKCKGDREDAKSFRYKDSCEGVALLSNEDKDPETSKSLHILKVQLTRVDCQYLQFCVTLDGCREMRAYTTVYKLAQKNKINVVDCSYSEYTMSYTRERLGNAFKL